LEFLGLGYILVSLFGQSVIARLHDRMLSTY
jgi:hypothetical protein